MVLRCARQDSGKCTVQAACVADLRSCVAGRGAAASTASWRRRGWRGVCQRHSGQPPATSQQRAWHAAAAALETLPSPAGGVALCGMCLIPQ